MVRESLSGPGRESTKIDGTFTEASEQKFRPHLFGAVARLVWHKPDAVIAAIAGVSDRQARDYLAGRVAAPATVYAALLVELTRRP